MTNLLDEYDTQLEQDMMLLSKFIAEDEEMAKQEYIDLGCPEELTEEFVHKERIKGKHWTFEGRGYQSDEVFQLLKELKQGIKSMTFRIKLNTLMWIPAWPYSNEYDRFSIKIITSDCEYWSNTNVLSDIERRKFLNIMEPLTKLYIQAFNWGIDNYYPSLSLMNFIEKMLIKYKTQRLLSESPTKDDKLHDLWRSIR